MFGDYFDYLQYLLESSEAIIELPLKRLSESHFNSEGLVRIFIYVERDRVPWLAGCNVPTNESAETLSFLDFVNRKANPYLNGS